MANVIIPPEHQSAPSTTARATEIVGPDGSVLNKPVIHLERREAETLKQYRKFLEKYALREAVYCSRCFEGNRADGTRFHVTPAGVMVECRCRTLVYSGLL